MPAQKPLQLNPRSMHFCDTIGRALATCLRLAQVLKREHGAVSKSSEYTHTAERLNEERLSLAFGDPGLNLFFGKLHLAVTNKSNPPAMQRAHAECALRVLTGNIVRQIPYYLGWAIVDWMEQHLRQGIPDQWSLPSPFIMKEIVPDENVGEHNTLEPRDSAALCKLIKALESVPLKPVIAPASHTRSESFDPLDSAIKPPYASSSHLDTQGRYDNDEASGRHATGASIVPNMRDIIGRDSQLPPPRGRLEVNTSSASSAWEFFDSERTRHDRSPSLDSLNSDASSIILDETNGCQDMGTEESLNSQEPNDGRVLEDFPGSPFRYQPTRWLEYRDPQSEDFAGREAPYIIQQDARHFNFMHTPFPIHDPIPPAYDDAFHTSPQSHQHDAQHSLDRDFPESFRAGGDSQRAKLVQTFLDYPFSVVKDLPGNGGISFIFLDTGVPWEVTDAVCVATPGQSTWFDVKEVHTKATLIHLLQRVTPERQREHALDLLHTRPMMLWSGAGRPKFEFRTLNPSQHYEVAGMNFQRGELSCIITCRCSTQDLTDYLGRSISVFCMTGQN
ncbi:hypothetical protein BDZ89DRAFT_1074799 [Hymenopellis radicata]|nr:hypothetical protein BDZ89DRAFT_1074799 [Hymenopellis radicata]